MKRRVIRAPSLATSICDSAFYIQQDNLRAAVRFVEAVEATVRRIIDAPESGSPYEPANPQLRPLRFQVVRGFKKYLVFYRFDDALIEIFRVVHGSMDLDSVLSGDA